MKIFSKLAIVIAALSLSFAAACSREKTSNASPETVRDVETLTVQRATLPSYYESVGTVRAVRSAQIGAQTAGNIVRMNVREGDRVSQGQVLAVLTVRKLVLAWSAPSPESKLRSKISPRPMRNYARRDDSQALPVALRKEVRKPRTNSTR